MLDLPGQFDAHQHAVRCAHYVVRRATRHTSEEIHVALFSKPPKSKSLAGLKAGIKQRVKQKHARR